MKVRTYLNYGGNCEEAFRFYEQHLGGKITAVHTWSQMPGDSSQTPPGWQNKVMHARLDLGDSELLGSDVPPDRFQPMRSVSLSISADSTPEAERIFQILSEGGEVIMPMQETFFAFRFGMLRDKFGTPWMILHERGAMG